MRTFFAVLATVLGSFAAPIVTLFYRQGWFNTPDDPVSPRGIREPFMRKLHDKVGTWLADYWWLGWRNKAYGLAYALKPQYFKDLIYPLFEPEDFVVTRGKLVRTIQMFVYKEYAVDFKYFHILYGYRLAPIYNEVMRNANNAQWDVPHRPINMDARPIISFRAGRPD